MSGGALSKTYDFVVIGGGPAGKRGAIQAAKAGKSVLLVDKRASVGGVCLHTGTIPSKTIRETVLNLSGWREREFYGRGYGSHPEISAADLHQRLKHTIHHEVSVLDDQFARNNVTCISAEAKFMGPKSLILRGADGEMQTVAFKKVLIAVGTRPYRPDNIPFDGKYVLDSDEILGVQSLPTSMVVIGAGVIGVEYATIFNALGIDVTIIEPRDYILDFLDAEIVSSFQETVRERGIDLRLGTQVSKILTDNFRCRVKLSDESVIETGLVLFTGGRQGVTDSLGLEACGLEASPRGLLSVDRATYQTDVPHIYAAGDIVGFPSLASTSMEQGRIAACHAFAVPMVSLPEHFPYGIYSVPEISTIGLTEAQLKERGIAYECGVAKMCETSRGHIMGVQMGLMKMMFARDDQRLLGVHIIGEGATELIHIGQAVLNLGGHLDFFINNIFNYPTLAEAYKIAALDAWNKLRLYDDLNVTDARDLIHSVPLSSIDTAEPEAVNS